MSAEASIQGNKIFCKGQERIRAGQIRNRIRLEEKLPYKQRQRTGIYDTKGSGYLLSYVNTQLRDYYDSLEALCTCRGLKKKELVEKLKSIDYEYDERDKSVRLISHMRLIF